MWYCYLKDRVHLGTGIYHGIAAIPSSKFVFSPSSFMTLLKSGQNRSVYEFKKINICIMQGCRNHKTELEGIVICAISGRVKTDFAKGNNLSPIYHQSLKGSWSTGDAGLSI